MQGLRAATVVAAVTTLAACGGSTNHAAPHGATTGRVAPVHVTLDETGERATSHTVGPAGANLVAVGRDGTRYKLSVPKGALASPVVIRVSPVRSIAGLPSGTRLAFAVDLAPHGLVFARAAWLTVRPPAGSGVQSGLAIDDSGVASLAPIGHNAHGYMLAVAHFSGTGGVRLPGGFGQWQNLQPGGSIAGSIQTGAISAGGPITVPPTFPPPPSPPPTAGPDPAPGDTPGTSTSSDPTLQHDIGDYLQQQADAQLTGNENTAGSDAGRAALVGRIVHVIDDLASQCVAGDPAKIVDIVVWQQRGMLLGMDDAAAEAARQQAIFEACSRFELVASGKFFFDAPPVFHVGDEIDLKVPLEFTGTGHGGSASATIRPTGYDRGGELLDVFAQGMGIAAGVNVPNNPAQNDYVHCTTDPGTIRGTAEATDMYTRAGPKIALSFATTRQSSVTCDGGVGTFQIPPFVTMTSELRGLGVTEATASGFQLTKLERSGGATPYAHEEIHKKLSVGQGSITADWTFTVDFAPGKLPPRG